MPWDLIAVALWSALFLGLVLGAVAAKTASDDAALASGLASIALVTIFSWMGALSIGPLVIAAATVLTALTATRHRPLTIRATAAITGFVLYWVVTWGVKPLQSISLLLLPALCLVTLIIAYINWISGRNSGPVSA